MASEASRKKAEEIADGDAALLREGAMRAWLIESRFTPAPTWWMGTDHPAPWTRDSLKAVRFCRKRDAEAAMAALPDPHCCFVSEHQWGFGGPMRGPEEEWMSLYDDLVRENADLRKSQAANEAELRRADETIGALRKRASEAELERDSMLSACVSACVSAGWYAEGGDPEGFILALRKRVEELEVSAGSAAMTIRMAQARAEKAEQRVEELEQTSFDLCPNCGWRTAGPDGCFKERAEKAERELERLRNERA